jgi:imidazolonepropionase-like amidohydrolase
MKRSAIAVAAYCFLATVAHAEVIAITGAKVYTMGPRGVVENATLLVSDGSVKSVIAGGEVPGGARVIDARGKVVTPGLFQPFSRLGLTEVDMTDSTVDNVQRGDQFAASFDVADAFNRRSTIVAISRVEGVTRAVIAPAAGSMESDGTTSSIFSGLASVVDLGNDADYLTRRGVAMVTNLGTTGGGLAGGSRAAALQILRTALNDARDYARHRAEFEKGARRAYSLSQADMEALQPVLEGAVPLLVNVNRASDIEVLANLVDEFGLRAIINGGAEAWMVADRVAKSGMSVIVESYANLPKSFDELNASSTAAKRLYEAGVRFTFAYTVGAGSTQNMRNITQSAGNAVANGLPWDAALAAITIDAAGIYGMDDKLGSLEAGKAADFVIWADDPLEVGNYPDSVFIDGKEMSMVTRQSLLRDRYLDLNQQKPPAWH